jgi:hypothetical protein
VDTFAIDGIQLGWQGRNQGFTLAGPHLRNATFMEGHTTDHLDIKVP